ncbi:MAG: TolC family protein [Planctomycetes bacterium]|nr:TolC family protein [Planctomycetota bacterium]
MTNKLFILTVLFIFIISFGCQEQLTESAYTDINMSVVTIQPETKSAFDDVVSPAPAAWQPTGAISLSEALQLAWQYNPHLATFPPQVLQAQAGRFQASLRPNPDLGYELEGFGGSGEVNGFNSAVNKLHVSQLFEMSQKRTKRERAAAMDIELVKWDYQSSRLDVTTKVTISYLEILAAQQRAALARELVGISEKVLIAAQKRVEAGKDSPVEESKARVALANFRIELRLAQAGLQAALRHLTATWGSQTVTFDTAEGTLESLSKTPIATQQIPLLEQLQQLLEQNPDLARWQTQIEKYQRIIELEKANSVADPSIAGGVHHFNESGDVGLRIGLEIPLQLFDRNQAGISASKHQLARAHLERRATQLHLDAELFETYKSLSAAQSVVIMLQNDSLPYVQQAFDAATLGYQEGKFDYLDVLDAQRTLFEAKGQYIEALKMYHQAIAEIERLIGGPLFDRN